MKLLIVALIISASSAQWYSNTATYFNTWRETFESMEGSFGLETEDSTLNLTTNEPEANDYLKTLATEQLELITKLPANDSAGKYFLTERDNIEQSEEFKAIKDMPKGAVLDLQDIGMGSVECLWKLMNATQTLYAVLVVPPPPTTQPATGTTVTPAVPQYTFRYVEPVAVGTTPDPTAGLIKISTLPANDPQIKDIKASLFVSPPAETECVSDPEAMWAKYNKAYNNVKYIVTYSSMYESYIRESLKEMAADGVDYMEVKTALYQLHFNGTAVKSSYEVAQMFLNVVQSLKSRGTIVSCRIVYTPPRNVEDSTLAVYSDVGNTLNEQFGTFIVGHDLQGQETAEHPLSLISPIYKNLRLKRFCFQAGDSNLLGSTADDNLMDALYMEPSRISGAFALAKHPNAMDIVKKKNIVISVNPIEHQLMGYCKNLRNHPVTSLLANDVKVVISAGAPGLYGAKGVSHSYYYALTAFGGKSSRLKSMKRFLKRAMNNNFMSVTERSEINQRFKTKWISYVRMLWGRSFNRPQPKPVT